MKYRHNQKEMIMAKRVMKKTAAKKPAARKMTKKPAARKAAAKKPAGGRGWVFMRAVVPSDSRNLVAVAMSAGFERSRSIAFMAMTIPQA